MTRYNFQNPPKSLEQAKQRLESLRHLASVGEPLPDAAVADAVGEHEEKAKRGRPRKHDSE